MRLDFYYDIVCPYAYLASTRVEALAARTGAELVWHPVLLGGLLRHVGAPDDPNQTMAPPRARLNLLDMHRAAELWHVPLKMPGAHPRRTVDAMRLLVGTPVSKRPALTHALYRAYWVEGRDVTDRAVLAELAAAHGVDPAVSTSTAAREGLFATTAQAARHGAFGVPALVVGDRLFWGQDRLHFVERALGGDPASVTEPRAPGPAVVEFFHDFSSPWSYLGSTQVARVASAHGATLKYRPMLLGALFRAIGTPDVPLLATNAAKRAYVARDLDDWARHWKVPFRFPDHFPLRTVTPLRVALVEPAATPHLYAAAWADNRPIDDDTVLAEVLTAAGFDAPALLEATQTPAIKQALRANTDAACALGACGAPTFVVRATPDAAPVLFWGQDRLDQVGRALNGWRPAFG